MSVTLNSTRKAVEIAWETGNPPVEQPPEEKPPGFPAHPIAPGGGDQPSHPIAPGGEAPDQGLPGEQPRPDHELPGDQPRPDHELPGDQPRPDHELPGDQPRPDQGLPPSGVKPEHPIYLPPYIDNSLPGDQPRPSHPIELPPDLVEGIPPEKLEELKSFLLGNLPPFEGTPEPTPMHGTVAAVQVFAQGQDGDWSNTAVMPNDGLAVLTYPQDFSGESYVEVRDLAGALIDYGTISVE
jgi:hypothetical protein